MKFKKEYPIGNVQKTFFAWIPISINGDTRWLEYVTIEGYHTFNGIGEHRFITTKFI